MKVKEYIEARIKQIEADEREARGCDECEERECEKFIENDCDDDGMKFSAEDVIQELKWVLEKTGCSR